VLKPPLENEGNPVACRMFAAKLISGVTYSKRGRHSKARARQIRGAAFPAAFSSCQTCNGTAPQFINVEEDGGELYRPSVRKAVVCG
jgi:hypothetical protein